MRSPESWGAVLAWPEGASPRGLGKESREVVARGWGPHGGRRGGLCTGPASGVAHSPGRGPRPGLGAGRAASVSATAESRARRAAGGAMGRQCGAPGRGPGERGQRREPGAAIGAGRGAGTWPRPGRPAAPPRPALPAPPPLGPPRGLPAAWRGPRGGADCARPPDPTRALRLPLTLQAPPTLSSSPEPAPRGAFYWPDRGAESAGEGRGVWDPAFESASEGLAQTGAGRAPNDPCSTFTRVVTQARAQPQG